MKTARRTSRTSGFVGILALLLSISGLQAAIDTVHVSLDVTSTLGPVTVADEEVAVDDVAGGLGVVGTHLTGLLPSGADLDAYERLSNGDQLFSLDTAATLSNGLHVRPGDVVRYDGVMYTVEFDSALQGLPAGVNVDAVGVVNGDLLLSFDVTTTAGGVTFADEDLAIFDGITLSTFLDGSLSGIGSRLNVDASHFVDACGGSLLLSFDQSGAVGGVPFDDEDVLEYDLGLGTWRMVYDMSANHPGGPGRDLDALHVDVDLSRGLVFGQPVFAAPDKTTFEWSTPEVYEAVRGMLANVSTYTVDMNFLGVGTSFTDAPTPPAGQGFWYLVRKQDDGCLPGSWQTRWGAEPERDASLP